MTSPGAHEHDATVRPAGSGVARPELAPADAPDFLGALQRLGYHSFRPGQAEAIEVLMQRRRLLLVAPTGGGKSLTFQLPASALPGTTIVLSPLIALMADQVRALEARGVTATFLASTLPGPEISARLGAMARGHYKLVYVAPERLGAPAFRDICRRIAVPLIAVDEAHCISEWGHDFRPEYLQIGELLADLPRARVLACTATATPVVRDEILSRLGLPADTPQIVRGFARPNLALHVAEEEDRRSREKLVDRTLEVALGRGPGSRPPAHASPDMPAGTAIIYAPTRKVTEQESVRLVTRGWRAEAYHAGLEGPQREKVQARFSRGELDVVVATNAFGMGIDRGDVRAVIDLAPPGSIEAYYQEVGRAGRDGQDAMGLLLIAPGDLPLRRRLIERGGGDDSPPDPAVVEHKWNTFLELMRWAEGGSCRHDAILRYFGDEGEALGGCGRCDVCRQLSADADDDPEATTLIVRKALSAVARIHRRFGLQAAVSLLRGAADERLERTGLVNTPTFGALREHDGTWLLRLLRRCVVAGWVDFTGDDRPVVVLTDIGRRVMRGELPARLLLPPRVRPASKDMLQGTGSSGHASKASARAGAPEAVLDAAALALFERLRAHRMQVASREGVPPYVVASDRSLRDLALLRPRSRDQLLLAHGIGPAKADKYGAGLLEVIAAAG
ncbi:RecQ family ATP-dependent DNA helicase [Nannocystis pusilla]|uniref:RecQ family ATP-dependent DNA helicase n=1 Tax=Nannocystis pusilla TaxID=889268 RepID=UPI003DA54AFC